MKLRDWRNSNDLSAKVLADLIGVAEVTLRAYETGSRRPKSEVALRIEAATDGEVTAAELLGLNVDVPTTKAVRETAPPFEAAPISVPVPADLAEMARKYDLNVEALIAEGGVPRLRDAFKAAYMVRHKEAIDEINASVREHGTLSQRYGTI